jgi:hypothetical protein
MLQEFVVQTLGINSSLIKFNKWKNKKPTIENVNQQ